MIGTTIAHYRVEEKIGEGGMGEVYLAHDTKLNRDVALKFLPDYLQHDAIAHKRFLREAQSAASIDHPYICNIYEVSQTDDGKDFIVMEYVQGQNLKQKLADKPLPLKEALQIGVEIAEALEVAHQEGIVHRDIKPANIMLTPQGHAKVMDFGLAKRVGDESGGEQEITATLTQEGSTLGTLAYMSPEQLRGAPVDSRSDIFSFGIMLYEMLTGVHPFRKGQSMETASAILTADPDPLTQHKKGIPALLEHAILKMLARDPKERYQSVHELAEHLNDPTAPWMQSRWSAGRFWGLMTLLLTVIVVVALFGWWAFRGEPAELAPQITSIAVLPLVNLSGDSEQEYFADGMTEALITDLSKIGALKVVSRSSTMFYKGTIKPLAEIARELNVEAIVEGSVLREGARVGISVQLIEAVTGHNLWADRYERSLTSILALQGEMARTIARQIHVTLTPEEESLLTRTRQINPEAYEAYLKGMSHFYRLIPAELETAKQFFELALEKDPDYALAHVGIALVWLGFRQMGAVPPHEAGPKVKAAIERAIELDDTLPEAYFALAGDKTWGDWDWEAGETAFLRAIELNPNYPDARVYYSNLLCYLGRPEEAIEQAERATELDPFNPLFQNVYGFTLFFAGRYDEAIASFRSAGPIGNEGLWDVYHFQGRHQEASDYAKAALAFYMLGSTLSEDAFEQGYKEAGYKGAMKAVAEMMAEISRETGVLPAIVAQLFHFAGEKERALEWLEKGYEMRGPMMPYIIWPFFHNLRDEPRYQELLRRMNFPEKVIARILEDRQSEKQ